MSQQSLTDLLGDIKTKYGDRIEAVSEGRAPANAWDGPPMPLTHEYRVKVDSAIAKPSNAGNLQFVITYEIQEPVEFEGRKLQAYINPKPTTEGGSRQFADFLGAMKAQMDGWGENNFDGFVAQFVGQTAVITLNTWGDQNDRYGVRWINADRGQVLKTTIAPAKPRSTGNANLTADIQIPKDKTEETAAPVVSPPETPAQTPAVTPPTGGPNLPPGLRT